MGCGQWVKQRIPPSPLRFLPSPQPLSGKRFAVRNPDWHSRLCHDCANQGMIEVRLGVDRELLNSHSGELPLFFELTD